MKTARECRDFFASLSADTDTHIGAAAEYLTQLISSYDECWKPGDREEYYDTVSDLICDQDEFTVVEIQRSRLLPVIYAGRYPDPLGFPHIVIGTKEEVQRVLHKAQHPWASKTLAEQLRNLVKGDTLTTNFGTSVIFDRYTYPDGLLLVKITADAVTILKKEEVTHVAPTGERS